MARQLQRLVGRRAALGRDADFPERIPQPSDDERSAVQANVILIEIGGRDVRLYLGSLRAAMLVVPELIEDGVGVLQRPSGHAEAQREVRIFRERDPVRCKPRVLRHRSSRRPTDRALSCEPQRLRRSIEAPKLQGQTLPEVDWGGLWLVSCSALLGSRLATLNPLEEMKGGRVVDLPVGEAAQDTARCATHTEIEPADVLL